MNDQILKWLSDWYRTNCDGNWEHNYGISIETIDNPGWSITIDIEETIFKINPVPWVLVENSVDDWYGYKCMNGKFEASGDPSKMVFLISLFKDIIEGTVHLPNSSK